MKIPFVDNKLCQLNLRLRKWGVRFSFGSKFKGAVTREQISDSRPGSLQETIFKYRPRRSLLTLWNPYELLPETFDSICSSLPSNYLLLLFFRIFRASIAIVSFRDSNQAHFFRATYHHSYLSPPHTLKDVLIYIYFFSKIKILFRQVYFGFCSPGHKPL